MGGLLWDRGLPGGGGSHEGEMSHGGGSNAPRNSDGGSTPMNNTWLMRQGRAEGRGGGDSTRLGECDVDGWNSAVIAAGEAAAAAATALLDAAAIGESTVDSHEGVSEGGVGSEGGGAAGGVGSGRDPLLLDAAKRRKAHPSYVGLLHGDALQGCPTTAAIPQDPAVELISDASERLPAETSADSYGEAPIAHKDALGQARLDELPKLRFAETACVEELTIGDVSMLLAEYKWLGKKLQTLFFESGGVGAG